MCSGTGDITIMNRDALFAKLETITNLPTLPAIMKRLTEGVKDPNANAEKIAGIIKDDPAMMARILKVINSAAYGASEPITSLQQAVAMMGLRGVQNIALSTSVFETFSRQDERDFNREEFWRHCICVGIAVNVLYNQTMEGLSRRYARDVLHLAGLLHDIGKIIFEHFFHEEFLRCLELSIKENIPLFEAECNVFGANHAEVGAWLATRWNMSEEVAAAVRFHHEPESAPEKYVELVRLCHTANYICCLEKIGDGGDNHAPVFIIGVWKRIGLKVRDIRTMVATILEESKESETLLSIMRG